jgi:putative addiction module component (TIGR02574 family)
MKAEQLIQEAKRLPEADRIRLAERVLATLDGEPDRDAAEAWADEIERRTREIEQGLVEPIPWSEVKESSARKAWPALRSSSTRTQRPSTRRP